MYPRRRAVRHRAFEHQLSVVDNRHAVAQALYHFEDVRGEEDGQSMAYLLKQDILHQACAYGIHPFKRLVH